MPGRRARCTDPELIEQVRRGDTEAYSRLYQRHVKAAYNLARQVARTPAEADDLVSEAFARVLDALRTGRGPDSAFRAYLLTTLRHTAYDKSKADRRIELSDDVTTMSGVTSDAVSVQFTDPAAELLERSLAAKAFHRLPERWQTVLWRTEIEERSPAEVAPLLGLSPNGVSALAYRAREGLRQAYLQAHLAEASEIPCRATVDRLGAWTRCGLSKRETAQVEHHLDGCASCRRLAAELVDMNAALRGVLPPLLLGADGRDATGPLAAATGGGDPRGGRRQPFLGAATAAAAIAAVAIGVGVVGEVPAGAVHTGAAVARTQVALRPPPVHQAQLARLATEPLTRRPIGDATGVASLGVVRTGDVRLRSGTPGAYEVTVHNTGSASSGVLSADLRLAPGVRALPAEPDTTRGPAATTVACPGGTGTVRCGGGQRVSPGGSATLRFVLLADDETSGHLGCTVRTGSTATSYDDRLSVRSRQPDTPGDGPAS